MTISTHSMPVFDNTLEYIPVHVNPFPSKPVSQGHSNVASSSSHPSFVMFAGDVTSVLLSSSV